MMKCPKARGIVPRYLDDELPEAQAAPLRTHLLSCPSCRRAAQEGKSLKAWFAFPPAVQVPDGFAARVARLARAGEGRHVPVPIPNPAFASGPTAIVADPEERVRSFVLTAVAVAALVLLALAIGLRRLDMPGTGRLSADSGSMERSLEALKAQNAREATEEEARSVEPSVEPSVESAR
jgi:anti-sigma factor RsiW